MDLGIVIVSYNTAQLTAECLASVQAALDRSQLNALICVVDNASSDNSVSVVREQFPRVDLVASDQNLGFAAGTNLGLERLAELDPPPRHALLLNPDTIVLEGALVHMSRFLDEHPRAGIVGAQLQYGDGRFQHSAFHFPTLAMAFFDFWTINHRLINSWLNGRYARRLYDKGAPFAIDHPLGAALMIRWDTLQEIGPLDTEYFMYCEEIDWCKRAKSAGWHIYCVPQARIVHLEGQSAKQFRDRMFLALWRSRLRLFDKHYSALYGYGVRIIIRAGLRRKIRMTRKAAHSGMIDSHEAILRIATYRQVVDMSYA